MAVKPKEKKRSGKKEREEGRKEEKEGNGIIQVIILDFVILSFVKK